MNTRRRTVRRFITNVRTFRALTAQAADLTNRHTELAEAVAAATEAGDARRRARAIRSLLAVARRQLRLDLRMRERLTRIDEAFAALRPGGVPEVPYCPACGTWHDAYHPHAMTEEFRITFRQASGREPAARDTYGHCKGLIRAAAEAATT
jgi:hypothetical protein